MDDEIEFCNFSENELTQICININKLISVPQDEIKGYYHKFKEIFKKGFNNNIYNLKTDQYDINKYIPIQKEKIYDKEDEWINTGIDMPICFSTPMSKKTIFIVGQDPLRNEQYYDSEHPNNEYAIIGTPYSLHNNYYRKNRFKELFSLIQSIVKEMEAKVYISDIYKIYFAVNKDPSINILRFTENTIHKKILKEEIDLLEPDLIISFGIKATESIYKIYNIQNKISITSEVEPQCISDKFRLLPMLHPSSQGQIHRKIFFGNNGIDISLPMNEGYLRIINEKMYF